MIGTLIIHFFEFDGIVERPANAKRRRSLAQRSNLEGNQPRRIVINNRGIDGGSLELHMPRNGRSGMGMVGSDDYRALYMLDVTEIESDGTSREFFLHKRVISQRPVIDSGGGAFRFRVISDEACFLMLDIIRRGG